MVGWRQSRRWWWFEGWGVGWRGPRWRRVTAAGCPCITCICVQAPCALPGCAGAPCDCSWLSLYHMYLCPGTTMHCQAVLGRRVTAAGCPCITCICVQAPLCTARLCWGAVWLQLVVPVSHVSVSRHHYALPGCVGAPCDCSWLSLHHMCVCPGTTMHCQAVLGRRVTRAGCLCITCVCVQAPCALPSCARGCWGTSSADTSAVVVQYSWSELDAVIFHMNRDILCQLDGSLSTGMERIPVQRLTWRLCVGGESVCVVHQDHTFTAADGGQGCAGESHCLSRGWWPAGETREDSMSWLLGNTLFSSRTRCLQSLSLSVFSQQLLIPTCTTTTRTSLQLLISTCTTTTRTSLQLLISTCTTTTRTSLQLLIPICTTTTRTSRQCGTCRSQCTTSLTVSLGTATFWWAVVGNIR